MDLSQYSVEQATHDLKCSHVIGHNCRDYTMPCILIGLTKSRMRKVVVFGNLYWKYTSHKKRVRYVPPWRLRERPKGGKHEEGA